MENLKPKEGRQGVSFKKRMRNYRDGVSFPPSLMNESASITALMFVLGKNNFLCISR